MICRLEHPEEKDILDEKLKPEYDGGKKVSASVKNMLSQMEEDELEDLLRELLA